MEINISLSNFDAPGKSAFYAFKKDGPEKLFNDVKISNGLAWSADEKRMYYIDSLAFRIDGFDYDAENVKLSKINYEGKIWCCVINNLKI